MSYCCSDEKCQAKNEELMKVIEKWKNEYEELLKENEKLKVELKLQQEQIQHQSQQLLSTKHYSHQFINCNIERMQATKQKETMEYRTALEKEQSERKQAEERERQLKEKLKDSNEVMAVFQRRMESLEKKLTAKQSSICTVCKKNIAEEKYNNVDLMQSSVFPRSSKYGDERDSNGSWQQQKRKQQEHSSLQNGSKTNKVKNKVFLYQ